MNKFRTGLIIDGRITAPADIEIIKKENNVALLDIKIYEGRNRQVRKMCKAINTPVLRLKRVAIGSVKLGDLPIGKYRYLTEKEVEILKSY